MRGQTWPFFDKLPEITDFGLFTTILEQGKILNLLIFLGDCLKTQQPCLSYCRQYWISPSSSPIISQYSQFQALVLSEWSQAVAHLILIKGNTKNRLELEFGAFILKPKPYVYKKLSFYIQIHIHIPNIYLRLGFEFGSQRIRDLAFVCTQFISKSLCFISQRTLVW